MASLSAAPGLGSRARLAGAAVLAVVVASLLNTLLVVLGRALFSVPDDFAGFQPVAYVALTCVGVIGASIAWSIIAAKATRPVHLLCKLAVTIVPVSMLADVALLVAGQSPGGVVVLMLMHVVVGVTTYYALTRIAPPRG